MRSRRAREPRRSGRWRCSHLPACTAPSATLGGPSPLARPCVSDKSRTVAATSGRSRPLDLMAAGTLPLVRRFPRYRLTEQVSFGASSGGRGDTRTVYMQLWRRDGYTSAANSRRYADDRRSLKPSGPYNARYMGDHRQLFSIWFAEMITHVSLDRRAPGSHDDHTHAKRPSGAAPLPPHPRLNCPRTACVSRSREWQSDSMTAPASSPVFTGFRFRPATTERNEVGAAIHHRSAAEPASPVHFWTSG
jgi:hypothetical protein